MRGRVWAIARPRRDDPRCEGRVREPRAIDFRGLRGCGSPIVGFAAVCAGHSSATHSLYWHFSYTCLSCSHFHGR